MTLLTHYYICLFLYVVVTGVKESAMTLLIYVVVTGVKGRAMTLLIYVVVTGVKGRAMTLLTRYVLLCCSDGCTGACHDVTHTLLYVYSSML